MAGSSQQLAAPSAWRVRLAGSLGLCSLQSELRLLKIHSLSGLRGGGAPNSSIDLTGHGLWVSHITSLSLGFLICKTGIKNAHLPTPLNHRRQCM